MRRVRKIIEKIKEFIYVEESKSEIRGINKLKEKLEELSTKIQRYEQDEEESIECSIFRKTLRFGSIQF